MTPPNARRLLGGYATGTLTRSEREELMRAALEDDTIFDELADEEDLREALADEPFRQRLTHRLRHLREASPPPWTERLARLFQLRWVTAAVAVAGLIVIVLVRQGTIPEFSPVARIALGQGTLPALHAAGILDEPGAPEKELESKSRSDPPPSARNATLGLDRAGADPEYRIGDRQRIGFSVSAPANVLLVEERPDGKTVRLFPNRYQSSAAVRPNETMLVPPAGQGDLEVEGPPGARTLRLLIFATGVDPLAADADWDALKGRAHVVERHYEVR